MGPTLQMLCDASSLDAIRSSNHSLHGVTISDMYDDEIPDRIHELPTINRCGTSPDAIRQKIIIMIVSICNHL